MSYETHIEATTAAAALLQRMTGSGWDLRVWENQGWHFELRNGPLQLYKHGDRYSCLLGSEVPPTGGEHFWEVEKRYCNPGAAIIAQLRVAREFLDRLNTLVSALEKRLHETGG